MARKLYYPGYQTRAWHPVVGCDHGAKLGCLERCWAADGVNRFGDVWGIGRDFRPRLIEKWLRKPLLWKKPQVVATGFEGDIACLPAEDIETILAIINATPHTYLLLTKDPARLGPKLQAPVPANVLMMATVRNQEDANRVIPGLLRLSAARFGLSMEPLLGPVDLLPYIAINSLSNGSPAPKPTGPCISWIVGGCESGRAARWGRFLASAWDARTGVWNGKGHWEVFDWLGSLRHQCGATAVPFWCKQAPVFKGGKWAVSSDMTDFRPDLQVQEMPR